jgi:hypothetical protein
MKVRYFLIGALVFLMLAVPFGLTYAKDADLVIYTYDSSPSSKHFTM